MPPAKATAIVEELGETTLPAEIPAEPEPQLSRREKAMLFDIVAGIPPAVVAAENEIAWPTFQGWMKESRIASALSRATGVLIEKIERGDFGAIPIAKASAEGAMVILLGLMRAAKSDETRRKAANDLLAYAGHQPVKRTQVLNPGEFLDAMTEGELEEFAASGLVPDRLRSQATFMVAKKLPKAIEAKVIAVSQPAGNPLEETDAS